LKASTADILIGIPVVPLLPVIATWWFLPWDEWIPKKVPKVILGPYILYAAFAAWHFKFGSFFVFIIVALGVGVTVAALIDKVTDP
jgi:hypothetical protein